MFLDCCRVRQVAAVGLKAILDCPLPVAGVERKTMIAYANELLKRLSRDWGPRGDAAAENDEADPERRCAATLPPRYWRRSCRGGAIANSLKPIARAAGQVQGPQIPLDMSEARLDARLTSR